VDAVILGLAGLARSGKDAAAGHLVAHHGYRRLAFADAIRDACYLLDPMVHVHGRYMRLGHLVDVVGWDRAKAEPDVRRLLQRMGTEVGRELWGEDVWVDRALAGVAAGDRVVVTDVRFPNEAAAVRALGGLVVRINREGAGLGAGAAHASEALAFPADHVVANDGTLDDLWAAIEGLVGV
jgi:hypothetical protein